MTNSYPKSSKETIRHLVGDGSGPAWSGKDHGEEVCMARVESYKQSNVGKSSLAEMPGKICIRNTQAVCRFPNGKSKGVWWMPWLHGGDEGRSVAAKRYGEVPSNL